jgi:hypothetical protein
MYEILNVVFAFIIETSSGVESQKMGFQNMGTNYTRARNCWLEVSIRIISPYIYIYIYIE